MAKKSKTLQARKKPRTSRQLGARPQNQLGVRREALRTRLQGNNLGHRELNQINRLVGSIMRELPLGPFRPTIRAARAYRHGRIRDILAEGRGLESSTRFGSTWRRIFEEQDELVSTSTMRELIQGLREAGAPTGQLLDSLEQVLEELSKLRFPTRWTGFANEEGVMQHPTAVGTGMFGDPRQTARTHRALDLARKERVARAMAERALDPAATILDIELAALEAGLLATLNTMLAPATASNVASRLQASPAEINAQAFARELLKPLLVLVGGKLMKGVIDKTRAWYANRQAEMGSPRRFDTGAQRPEELASDDVASAYAPEQAEGSAQPEQAREPQQSEAAMEQPGMQTNTGEASLRSEQAAGSEPAEALEGIAEADMQDITALFRSIKNLESKLTSALQRQQSREMESSAGQADLDAEPGQTSSGMEQLTQELDIGGASSPTEQAASAEQGGLADSPALEDRILADQAEMPQFGPDAPSTPPESPTSQIPPDELSAMLPDAPATAIASGDVTSAELSAMLPDAPTTAIASAEKVAAKLLEAA